MTALAAVPSSDAALGWLPAIGIDALESDAALLTRHDRKYVVDRGTLGALLEQVVAGDAPVHVLDIDGARWFGYESVYFDTPELRSYHLAATGRPRRFKVRTRSYLDRAECMIEVKERNGRQQTVKHRAVHPFDARSTLTADDRGFLSQFAHLIGADDTARLGLALTTTYRRATLVVPESGTRVTIDVGLRCTAPDGRATGIGDHAIVETKSLGPPTGIDRCLWTLGVRPVRISKYAAGLAALRPELPANRWSRVLDRYFGRRPAWSPTEPARRGPSPSM